MSNAIFPNQRNITIHKPRSKSGDFTTVNLTAAKTAMKNLSYSAYMLYSYFNLNADGFNYYPSKAHICQETALTKNTYYKAMQELECKGYLVPCPGYFSKFDFYESPKKGPCNTEKTDDVSQKSVENIYNNKDENKKLPTPELDAPGGAPEIKNIFFNF